MPKILVVEDEESDRRLLTANLSQNGYEVLTAGRGDVAVELALRENPDLVLLDVGLPGINGFEVCRRLQQKGVTAPIIMLTVRGEEIDRVTGLEIGAADYVTKPYSMRELLARVRAHLRRAQQPARRRLARCRFGDVEVDFDKMAATRDGTPLELAPKEFALLEFLIRSQGEPVSREEILKEVWGYGPNIPTRTVDTHILKLRHKLEPDPANPQHIRSVYGVGYRFVG